ncbi:MAG: hypothetical protein H6585_10950 [Flavobacteriales bacterium]|nr:hypothetical protein [Flavobacteriales bacterium]MCB9448851.1 hypothetical protein [Flavobacteriales bacterium]
MIKALLVVLHLSLVSLLQMFSVVTDDVTIVQTVPSEIKAGQEFTVEITIVKNDLTGLAKLQQDLPQGFTATAGKTADATFTFKDNSVKFIWMSMPATPNITLSYTVKVGENVPSGEMYLGGRFSYVKDNERKMASVPVKKVAIVNEHPEKIDDAASLTTPPVTGEAVASGGGTIEASRRLSDTEIQPGSEFTVTVEISKSQVAGYAKLQETLPKGYSASQIETQGAIFSFVDQDVKFLWMNLPDQDHFTVSYKVKTPAKMNAGDKIDGAFTFMENEESKKYVIATSEIIAGAPLAMNPPADNNGGNEETDAPTETEMPDQAAADNTNTNKQDVPTETASAAPPVQPKTTPPPPTGDNKNSGGDEKKVTGIPAPQQGVIYRVQVMALRNTTVSMSYFKDKKNISETVNQEQHNGWNKYTVGALSAYQDARNKRETLRNVNQVHNPFVTAYNGAKRITVQEALMISNQKWVP